MIDFGAPAALAALLSVPLILYLYRLRPRRREHVISSLELWREALRRRQPSNGLTRLLRNFSLLLLLATALALALALADPKWLETRPTPSDLALVVDTSASMQAQTASSSRFALAIEQARAMIAARPEGARTALISSATHARLLVPYGAPPGALNTALEALRATDETGHPEQAMALAASLQTDNANGQIVFLTDGAFASSTLAPRRDLTVIQVGDAQANVGITQFQVRAHPRVPGQFAVFARVHNFATTAADVALRLDVAGAMVARFTRDIAPGAAEVVNAEFGGLGGAQVTLTVERPDALAVDNQAFAVLPTRTPLLLSVPSRLLNTQVFLASALEAMPHVGVVSADAGTRAEDTSTTRQRTVDVIVTDAAGAVSPPGNFLVFGAAAANGIVGTGAEVKHTSTLAVGNPLLGSGLDFSDVTIHRARLLTPQPDNGYRYEPLLRVADGDIAAALLGADARVVVFGFLPDDTSMPLRPTWPILLDEALTWLAGQRHAHTSTAVSTGSALRMATDVMTGEAQLTLPSGAQRTLTISDGEAYLGNASEAGFYTFIRGRIYRPLAANLASVTESDIRPRLGARIAPQDLRQTPSEQASTLWPWLLLLALLALAWETGLHLRLPRVWSHRIGQIWR